MYRCFTPILIVCGLTAWAGASPAAAPPARARFPVLSNTEAWARLPRVEPALPAWARALAESLPVTTARMIELDNLHRSGNPLGAALAARVRREVADVLAATTRSATRRRTCGGPSPETPARRRPRIPAGRKAERAALAFARKLTRAGHEVTDAEVAELIDLCGPEQGRGAGSHGRPRQFSGPHLPGAEGRGGTRRAPAAAGRAVRPGETPRPRLPGEAAVEGSCGRRGRPRRPSPL